MASFFVRNNSSGSSFKSISGAVSRKEVSDFTVTGFRISLMIVAVDRQKLAWLLNENCSASIICVLYNTRKFYLKILLRYGQRQFGKKKNNEKAAIKLAHTRASQTLEIVAAC